jgi:hypothetical protein
MFAGFIFQTFVHFQLFQHHGQTLADTDGKKPPHQKDKQRPDDTGKKLTQCAQKLVYETLHDNLLVCWFAFRDSFHKKAIMPLSGGKRQTDSEAWLTGAREVFGNIHIRLGTGLDAANRIDGQ